MYVQNIYKSRARRLRPFPLPLPIPLIPLLPFLPSAGRIRLDANAITRYPPCTRTSTHPKAALTRTPPTVTWANLRGFSSGCVLVPFLFHFLFTLPLPFLPSNISSHLSFRPAWLVGVIRVSSVRIQCIYANSSSNSQSLFRLSLVATRAAGRSPSRCAQSAHCFVCIYLVSLHIENISFPNRIAPLIGPVFHLSPFVIAERQPTIQVAPNCP